MYNMWSFGQEVSFCMNMAFRC